MMIHIVRIEKPKELTDEVVKQKVTTQNPYGHE